jgi:GTP-binding protein HflX
VPVVALVGYTNAGKSTLLNALSGAGVLAEDKLFATLDPTTRRVRVFCILLRVLLLLRVSQRRARAGRRSSHHHSATPLITPTSRQYETTKPKRKVRLRANAEALVSDTVGFIQKLPPQLVAAFAATLEEVRDAAVVVHVLDASAPNAAAQCDAVLQVRRRRRLWWWGRCFGCVSFGCASWL